MCSLLSCDYHGHIKIETISCIISMFVVLADRF